jgi:transposase
MTNKRYTEEFKIEAVKQITERGHAAAEVAARLGVSTFSLYQWVKRYTVPEADRVAAQDHQTENRRLKAELKRVTEERDILKKAAAYLCPRGALPRSPGEVRIYPERGTQPRGASAMQDDGRASERLLRLVCHSRFEAHD